MSPLPQFTCAAWEQSPVLSACISLRPLSSTPSHNFTERPSTLTLQVSTWMTDHEQCRAHFSLAMFYHLTPNPKALMPRLRDSGCWRDTFHPQRCNTTLTCIQATHHHRFSSTYAILLRGGGVVHCKQFYNLCIKCMLSECPR